MVSDAEYDAQVSEYKNILARRPHWRVRKEPLYNVGGELGQR